MADARRREEWDRLACLRSDVWNARMGVKRQNMIDPAQLNPYTAKKRRRRVTPGMLAAACGVPLT